MNCLLFALSLLFNILSIQGTNFTICDNGKKPPIYVDGSGCTEQPCKFILGQTVTFLIDFEVDQDVTVLQPLAHVKAMGVDTYYPLPQQDACLAIINGECPLDKGEEVTCKIQMPIKSTFPKISFQVEFSLVSNNVTITCFKINGETVDQ